MEEVPRKLHFQFSFQAELLCSRIGIMAEGELHCLGSPLHLKSKFADGYRLIVSFTKGSALTTK